MTLKVYESIPVNHPPWEEQTRLKKSHPYGCHPAFHKIASWEGRNTPKWMTTQFIDTGFISPQKEHLLDGSNIFYVHPYLGKPSNLTDIFQMGWKPPTRTFMFFQAVIFTGAQAVSFREGVAEPWARFREFLTVQNEPGKEIAGPYDQGLRKPLVFP